MQSTVLPSMEGMFLLQHLEDSQSIEIEIIYPRMAVAQGEAPISYTDAMQELRRMRGFGIFSIAPMVLVSNLGQNEIDRHLSLVKGMDDYILWRCGINMEPFFEEMKKRIQTPPTEDAIAIFDQMEKNALANPFEPPFPIQTSEEQKSGPLGRRELR